MMVRCPTRWPISVTLAIALTMAGCESLLGIEDPVLAEGEPQPGEPDAGGGEHRIDAGQGNGDEVDAAPGGEGDLVFEPAGDVCPYGELIAVDAAQGDDELALVGLTASGEIWLCYAPFFAPTIEVIPPGEGDVGQDLWVGDLTGDGRDEIAVISSDHASFYHRSGEGDDWIVDQLFFEGTLRTPLFITGADVTQNGLTDLVVVGDVVLVLENSGEGLVFFTRFQTEVPPLFDAGFAHLGDGGAPAIVALANSPDGPELFVLPAFDDPEQSYYYDGADVQGYGVWEGAGEVVILHAEGDDLFAVALDTTDGVVLFPRADVGSSGVLDTPVPRGGPMSSPVATGDLTHDGLDDSVSLAAPGSLTAAYVVTADESSGTFPLDAPVEVFTIVDVDGDGLRDVVGAGSDGAFLYLQQPR